MHARRLLALVLLLVALRIGKGQSNSNLAVKLVMVTQTSISKPLRNPAFASFRQDRAKGSDFLFWKRGFEDKAKGEVTPEPRQTYWSLLSVLPMDKVEFPDTFSPIEFNYGQQGESLSSSDFTTINITNKGYGRFSSTYPLLIHSLLRGGGSYGTYHVASQKMVLSNNDSSVVALKDDLYSELPTDGKDPLYLSEVRRYKAKLEETARERGGRVVDAKDWIEKRVDPKPNDVIYLRDSVWSSLDFFRVQGVQDSKRTVWLTGLDRVLANTDTPQDYLWVTHSNDEAKTWEPRKLIGRGNYPTVVDAKNGDLLVFSTQTTQFGWQGEWPDDDLHDPQTSRRWPGRGLLMLQRSKDNGKTWSQARKVLSDNLVIQNRVYRAPDGRLWLVYVQSDAEQRQRTSLWLTSSTDNGQTWQTPQRLTDGKTLDREPDLLWHDGKLLIAFSRAGRGINTNIWLATVSP